MTPHDTCRPSRGFTLIELLVVIAVIALLISILLPSLSKARDAARDVICMSNESQIGKGIQMYMDDQKDPRFPDVLVYKNKDDQNPERHRYKLCIQLADVMGSVNSTVYICPSARGATSVRDPYVRKGMESQFVYQIGGDQAKTKNDNGTVIVNEYWVNDSRPARYTNQPGRQHGVANQLMRLIEHPDEVVWIADAVDWIPRHGGKASLPGGNNVTYKDNSLGKSHLLFGDLSVRKLPVYDYWFSESTDKYGAPGPFYNWGHYYPDRWGP
ncbi:MAG TPA: prepilin-type N-terminal cleavage/methylation domain-containing protein [Phycisphaerales bacterium]|nr:prepilin-type N-terminal cleavage/methylation domain-containing protein [Phycisphaerales bacterium]